MSPVLIFIQILINGLVTGAIYSLIAVGISLVYSTSRFFHFAHGAVVAVLAYLLYFFFTLIGLNFWLSIIIVTTISVLLGWSLNTLFKQFRKRKVNNTAILVSGFSILVILRSIIIMSFGADMQVIGNFWWQKSITLSELTISPLEICILFFSSTLLVFLFWFMKNTNVGRTIRAVSDNRVTAEILGISAEKIHCLSMIIATVIGAAAGIFIGLEWNISPDFGINLSVNAFAAIIIGGISSVPGAILGAYLLGVTENFVTWFSSPSYSNIIAFILLIFLLLLRREGILGTRKGEEK